MKKPSLLVSIPVEPGGMLSVDLVLWMQALPALMDRMGFAWKWDIVRQKPVAGCRNSQCVQFLASGLDYLLTVDNDAIPDEEGTRLLLDAIQRPEVDAVAGWSVMLNEDDGPQPCLLRDLPDGGAEVHAPMLERPAGLYELSDGTVGAHCLAVKRETLLKFRESGRVWFSDVLLDGSLPFHRIVELASMSFEDAHRHVQGWIEARRADTFGDGCETGTRRRGQDVYFCRTLRALGMRLWVDTRVLWGHLKPTDIRMEFLESQGRIAAEQFEGAIA